ncbi:MAG: GNAT family N-acetyltransferase, partial [Planctomycetes bacterium]|nr:GNAT family N-acetyltransferase [Planctomycetota bacterium]
AILDIDYHHGNGQQEIFYHRDDLLTISIHGHPSFAYPYFSGFEDENGEGEGVGYNMNIPLAESIAPTTYRKALARALVRIDEFGPEFLVVALGLDPAKGDPTGTWSLKAADFEKNGSMIGELWLPTVVIQEGGYRTRNLGANARAFFQGLAVASYGSSGRKVPKINLLNEIKLRYLPVPEDIERVRSLVTKTGFFYDYEIPIAVELVEERLAKGEASGYNFIFAESYGRVAGYVAYGQIACTASSYDLFWIAVHPDFQGRGVGKLLLTESEKLIAAAGGTRIYIETSHREKYASTRGFYERCGYHLVSLLEDFYGPGDAKATYCRELVPLKKAPSR